MIYTTALDTYATTSLTAFARTLLDDVDAGTARTTLGLGALAVENTVSATGLIDNGIITEAKLDSALQTKVNNSAFSVFNQSGPPTVNDDSANTSGNGTFAVGSTWIDTTNDEAYRCVDATPTSAVWINTTLTTSELGTMAVQNANAVNITGGSIAGITDLAVADGGTGASTAGDARTNLGLVIGTDVQAYSANLDTYASNPLTAGEITQLQNINATTISTTQWGYVGNLDQDLTASSSVSFADITLSGTGASPALNVGHSGSGAAIFINHSGTGNLIQSTEFTVDQNGNIDSLGYINLPEIATPANPSANEGRLFVADDGGTTTPYFVDSAGTVTSLLGGGGSGDVV